MLDRPAGLLRTLLPFLALPRDNNDDDDRRQHEHQHDDNLTRVLTPALPRCERGTARPRSQETVVTLPRPPRLSFPSWWLRLPETPPASLPTTSSGGRQSEREGPIVRLWYDSVGWHHLI